jgi:hypothetical protein
MERSDPTGADVAEVEIAIPEAPGVKLWRFRMTSPRYADVLAVRRTRASAGIDDAFDVNAIHYLLEVDGRPSISMRVHRAADGPMECEEFYPAALRAEHRAVVASASRLVARATSGRDPASVRDFVRSVWRDQLAMGTRLDLVNVAQPMVGYYRRLGYLLVPNSGFIHPRLGTQSVVMLMAADGRAGSTFSSLLGSTAAEMRGASPELLAAVDDALRGSDGDAPRVDEAHPRVGSHLALTSGRTSTTPRYRIVDETGVNSAGSRPPDRLAAVATMLPALGRLLDGECPLLVNAYPATLGSFPTAVRVDTHGREVLFAGAIALARRWSMPSCVLGQPFAIADALARLVRDQQPLPERVALGLGGYECPASLEAWLMARIGARVNELVVVHAYGCAEIDFACLVGTRDRRLGAIDYRMAVTDVVADVDASGNFVLARSSQRVETGDLGERSGSAWRITPGADRIPPDARAWLESWSIDDWDRRTGYVVRRHDRWVAQLRVGEAHKSGDEQDHFDFARVTGLSMLDKPVYGTPAKSSESAAPTPSDDTTHEGAR